MTTISRETKLAQIYPEVRAGGFSRCDGTVGFYQRVNALLGPEMNVLDVGAGRGTQLMQNSSYRSTLCRIQGKVREIVGVDIDTAVLENPFLDKAIVIEPECELPFAPSTFDLILADWVLEHVQEPKHFSAEIYRVLRPGGWFCARTPNRWGLTGIAANIVPNRFHNKILSHLQPTREVVDIFPTAYKMNTSGKIAKYFQSAEWENCSYSTNSEPPYVQGSVIAMRLVQLAWRLAPPACNTVLNVFLQKKS